jgi:DNA-binding MarR family transcriptional regulator
VDVLAHLGELADQVFVDSPTLTKIVDRMVTNADVYRAPDPHDRRKVLIFLSEKGKATFEDLRSLVEEPESGLVGRLDRRDAKQLRSLLENLLDRS